jgi:putative glycosyltransferase (TIGR04372 family)
MRPDEIPDLGALIHARNSQKLYLKPGSDSLATDRPFLIFALQLDRTLGDFIMRCLFAASVKLLFENARLHVYFRNDRPYKRTVIKLLPWIDKNWAAGGSWTLPADWFDVAGSRPVEPQAPDWDRTYAGAPDLLLTPSMMGTYDLGAFETVARMRVPDDDAEGADRVLRGAGVDPRNWFCILHYREPSFGYRGDDSARDLDPQDAIDVTRHITRELGGQVVRIGHPEMTPFPAIDGFVDLSRHRDALMLHAYATSRARFFFEASPSGPMALAAGFGVPMARCNTYSLGGPADSASILLPQHLVGPDGKRVDQAFAISRSLILNRVISNGIGKFGYRLVPNSRAELQAAAREIFERTTDCPGWRTQAAQVTPPPTNTLELPLPHVRRFKFVEYPHLAPDFSDAGNASPGRPKSGQRS